MALKEQIKSDLNKSVKGKEELSSSVLRLLLAVILNKEKEKRYKLKEDKDVQLIDEEIIDVISSETKKRREAIELYEKGGR
ncbi:MAG: GatB/YqeY domain-containing protein, partial [Candidatus Nealsonbacteria bacterium]